ncbi:unnamed protein product [Caenorhabditis nigoni]|uniref:Uncharacterized protein n=1 Tax=Caenorhabditis nigoni TaxID=1611254 RepID=A0A2G5SCW4_9PELO|nr:hypothetical protein B9Z55_028119 [Caenorhabditis nigoni]
MVNNQRKFSRKSKDIPEDPATKNRILNLLKTMAPRENSPVPVSNSSSRPSTSTNNRKRRAVSPSSPRRQQPTVSRTKRSARASAVRANETMRRIISDEEEEVVGNPSTQPSTSGLPPNEPRIRDHREVVRANQTTRRMIDGNDSDEGEEVVNNPSSQETTSGSSHNEPGISEARQQISTRNKSPGGAVVKREATEIDYTFPEKSVKTERPIGREQENLTPERKNIALFDQVDAEFEFINMDIAINDNANQQGEAGPEADAPEEGYEMDLPSEYEDYLDSEDDYQMAAAVPPVPTQPIASNTITARPTPLAEEVAASTASVVVPATSIEVAAAPTLSEVPQTQEPVTAAAALPQQQQLQQDQEQAQATFPPLVATPVVRLDRPQRPDYLNAERAALLQLRDRSSDFRTWNAEDVHEWLGLLPNQSAAFQVLREKVLEFDGSGDFLNQLLSGPESVKSASEMLNASILHCHAIRRHVAALENCRLEAEYTKAMEEFNKQNN